MIKKMSMTAYHKADGLSKSMMDYLKISPAHFKYNRENPTEETESMLLGSLFHTMVLEPKKFDKEYAIAPECDRRTSAGKQIYQEFMDKNSGKKIITQKQFDTVSNWVDAIKKHPVASKLITGRGKNEVSIFWTDDGTGEICKARLDRIKNDTIIDLKTTVSAQQDDFERSAHKLGYHRQAYWFSEAYEQEFGTDPKFVIIAVEKTAPFNVVVYKYEKFAIEVGGKECRELLKIYHHCKQTNNWYGYDGENNDVQPLTLPNYIILKNMEEI